MGWVSSEADSNTLRVSSHSQPGEADCPLSGTALTPPYVRIEGAKPTLARCDLLLTATAGLPKFLVLRRPQIKRPSRNLRKQFGEHFDQFNELMRFKVIVVVSALRIIWLMSAKALPVCFVEHLASRLFLFVTKHIEAQCADGRDIDVLPAPFTRCALREN